MADVAAILNPLPGVVGAIAQGLDGLFTSDEERLRAQLDMRAQDLKALEIDAGLLKGQQDIAKEEAKSASIFVAGARPAAMWVCVLGLGYQFLIHPLLTWGWALLQAPGWVPMAMAPPPMLDLGPLTTILIGMLGLSANRTFERLKGVERNSIQ